MNSLVSKALALSFLFSSLLSIVFAQDSGYIGYSLSQNGSPEDAVYETASTDAGTDVLVPEPDVFLNASISVGEIDIEVDNITAKVNLDAKVLNLLRFNAGVDASIDRVRLNIQNVSAKVLLEARLENVVEMIGDVLNTIDLNPVVATLGRGVSNIVGNATDSLGGSGSGEGASSSSAAAPSTSASSAAVRRSSNALDYNMAHNILYSVNDYSGHTHTNRVLSLNGTILDVYLDNNGNERGRRAVGSYSRDMTFTGHNRTITIDGQTEFELGYLYAPYAGLEVTSIVLVDSAGKVVRTQVVAEAEGAGTSTVSDDDQDGPYRKQ